MIVITTIMIEITSNITANGAMETKCYTIDSLHVSFKVIRPYTSVPSVLITVCFTLPVNLTVFFCFSQY